MSDNGACACERGSPTGNAPGDRTGSGAVPRTDVAVMKSGKYRVVFERDGSGAWIARVPRVRGCHTYGRTLQQARRRIREALSLWVEDADSVELVEDVRLPASVRNA